MDIIGIFGGTFNPIHNGHLVLAKTVLDTLHCAEIRFIPAATPPHKSTPSVTAQHRAEMVRLAISDQPQYVLDPCELERGGPSYTIDTLIDLRSRFPHHALCLLMGQDSYSKLPSWHRWQALLEVAHLLVVHRSDHAASLALHPEHADCFVPLASAATAFSLQPHGLLTYLPTPPPGISSTEIRQQLTKTVSILSELPPKVLNYIRKHHLYLA